MFDLCQCVKQPSLVVHCDRSWRWILVLLYVNTAIVAADLQLAPHFTYIPSSVTPFVATAENASTGHQQQYPLVDLLCRAWPPNARVSLVASSASNPFSVTSPKSGIPAGLLLWHHGLLTHPVDTGSRSVAIDQTVHYASLKEAVHHHPAALPADEVAVRLTIPSVGGAVAGDSAAARSRALKQLESMRLHCMAETPFGSVISRPFRIRSTTLGDFRAGPGAGTPGLPAGVAAVQPSTTTSSSSASLAPQTTTTLKILRNNVGVVDCYLPANAYPTPGVELELNGSLLDVHTARHSEKYRLVHRPDNRRVSLLIRQFQAQDAGRYQCFFVNPLTGQRKRSPAPLTNLQLIRPHNPFPATVFTPLASAPVGLDNGMEQAKAQVIVATEGDNITLFCVIHAAPPPTVTTYPFQFNNTGHTRFQRDDMFGLLHITNVQPSDSGFYICSERQISSTAQLRVKSLLRLVNTPRDVSIPRLGVSVQFNCTTSDPQVKAEWLVNGRSPDLRLVRHSGGQSTLTIPDAGRRDLGFYQCVAWRPPPSAGASPTEGEWVNATAMLTLGTDKMLLTPDDVKPFLPKNLRSANLPSTPESTADSQTPSAEVVFDNLAVLLSWLPVTPTHIPLLDEEDTTHHGNQHGLDKSKEQQPPAVEYRLEYSVQQTAIEVAAASASVAGTTTSPTADGAPAESAHGYTPMELAKVFIGFVGFDAIRWSEPRPLKQQVSTAYMFIAGPPLEPENQYRFRVLALSPVAGTPIQSPSGWSKVVSMEHISSTKPPEIQIARPLSDGQVHVIWKFEEQTPDYIHPAATSPKAANDHELFTAESIQSTSGINSSTSSSTVEKLFNADHFLILARPVVKPKRGAESPLEYGTYSTTTVNGSDTREGLLTGLNRSMDYQIIIYAVRGTGPSRQITRFSKPVFINFVPSTFSGRYSILASLADNKVLYMVLGGIAALMILVVFLLVLLCMCRQLRDGPRRISAERKKQNGYMRGNSDAVAGGNGYKSPSVGAPAHHSTPDGVNGTGQLVGPVSLPDYYPQPNRQSQGDPYNSQKDPLLSNNTAAAALPSHQMMMGSQFQLANFQQAAAGSQQTVGSPAPPHHQSHHSLLLSPNSNSVLGPSRLFQTGTLPAPGSANQRYYRSQQQQQQPGMMVYNGSNNNRATTPGPMLEMTEYGYQQQQPMYAPHQQLPPIPHPHSPDQQQHQLMTSGGGVAMSPQQQQMGVYYPAGQIAGLMTPGGMSLKRDQLPPSALSAGGSLREHGSAYGTILQRGGHLTGSFISDHHQHQMSGTLQPGCNLAAYPVMSTTYYQQQHHPSVMQQQQQQAGGMMGSQQALHMASPTPMMQAYHQQQQQQQQYPMSITGGVYYGQQTPSEVMFVGGGGGGVIPQQLQQQGFRPADGESIYSYFSQHDATGIPGGHQHLNALPEENNPMFSTTGPSGYVDSGIQTGELNSGAVSQLDNDDSPAGGGAAAAPGSSHRHHRRRRRKQPQQPGQRHTSESTNGDSQLLQQQMQHMSDDQLSQPPPALANDTQAGETQITPLELSEEVKRQLSLSAGGGGTYSDADPLSGQPSFASPPPPPGYHLQQSFSNGTGVGMDTNWHSRNYRYDSPQHGGGLLSSGVCPLPPPNQPPPPPPPNATMTYSNGCEGLPGGPGEFTNGGFYPNNINSQRVAQFYSPPGSMDYCRDYQSHSGASAGGGGLLVGPPPRVRDYSEYGIPRGIGLPPTPDGAIANGNSPLQQQQFVKGHMNSQFVNNGMGSPPVNAIYSGNNGVGHYREGQA